MASEYTHRTLALLLSQPAPRSRILLIKIGVLAVMVVSLAASPQLTLFEESPASPPRSGSQELRTLILLLIVMTSVCLAPAMTMLSRSQLAGTVFTITVPGLLLFAAELIQYAWYGFRSADQEAAARIAVMRWGLMPICVLAGMAIWPMFARLSAIDGRGARFTCRTGWGGGRSVSDRLRGGLAPSIPSGRSSRKSFGCSRCLS